MACSEASWKGEQQQQQQQRRLWQQKPAAGTGLQVMEVVQGW
jgi:hypothetical protein